MCVKECVVYPVVIVVIVCCSDVLAVTVDEHGVADFSDEEASKTFISACCKGITNVNTTTMKHLNVLQGLGIPYNEFKELPDLTVVSDTLDKLGFYNNPSLSRAGNVELAVLKRLRQINIRFTNLTVLTTTCPQDSEQEYRVLSGTLDLCDCQHIWLKVSYDENNQNIYTRVS